MSLVKPQISTTQLVILLLLSRAFTAMNYVPIFEKRMDISAHLIGNVIGMFIGFLMLVPIFVFNKKFNGESIISVAMQKNKALGFIVGGAYILLIMLNISGALVGFEFFMTNAIYPSASIIFIILSISIASALSAFYGLEGLARAATIIFIVFISGIVFIAIVASKSVDLINIKPIIDDSAGQIFSATSSTVSKFTEIVVLLLLLPNVRGCMKKSAVIYVVASTLLVETISFLIIGVLGEYAYTQTFPYYTLASITETEQFQRLDSIHMSLWVGVSFIKIALFMIVVSNCIRLVFPKLKRGLSFVVIFIITSVPACVVGLHPEVISSLNTSSGLLTVIFAAAIPITLCLSRNKKEDLYGKENIIVDSSVI